MSKKEGTDKLACTMGELFRNAFWPSTKKEDIGCFTNFVYSPDVYNIEDDGDTHWADLDVDGIIVHLAWCWDGDGYITFTYFDPPSKQNKVLVNNDCKKDYNWEYV